MFLHTWHPSAIAFSFGDFKIHWYGIFLALGALAGYALILRLAKRQGIKPELVTNLLLLVIPIGLLGGRLYHVLNEWGYYRLHANEIFSIWNGGLAIHGALIAGVITVWLYARRHKLSIWTLLDVITPGMALGQAIGRWGNYFNQELFGKPTNLPWGIPIDPNLRPFELSRAPYFHPTFIYESLGNVMIAAILVWLLRKKLRPGTVALEYFALYAILRILTESIRIDRTPTLGALRLPIVVSALMILAVIILFITRRNSPSHVTPRKA